ncbi:CubicO group peptidase (beta-lactamase class C family) [Flavobacterium sp. 270]|uniref:serine hydrolase domain-containing protein n=1 Tax=Flavobacterium sp. 270 TaxID=2512114 RepID=UPI0010669B59|nr:serine hydrolase domain-containing protein [Flavobacterium sp. 270]TDW48555.1 CubicO group peptidase (beta-lactamase class C family) [Flavobacterium sp. 270]
MKYKLVFLFFLSLSTFIYGQNHAQYADSIRKVNDIPEISYAVITADKILEINALGFHSTALKDPASLTDRFHIGSNTKAMTAFVIAKYVEKGKLKWNTKFFDLFPDLKKASKPEYYAITLQDLLSHRGRIQAFQGENDTIVPNFKGNSQEKRNQFGAFVLTLKPVALTDKTKYVYSNAGYTLATMMLEKVIGKSWEQLINKVFNEDLKMNVKFSWPENQLAKDTWGHSFENNKLVPVPSNTDYHLDFTEPSGDLNLTLQDYIRFIQLNIQGLQGHNNYLKASTYKIIHKGVEEYSLGWFNSYENDQDFSTHAGTAGTYYTLVSIDRKKYIGYIIFTNSFSETTVNGVRLLMRKLKKDYTN